jgi:hypothetical protein
MFKILFAILPSKRRERGAFGLSLFRKLIRLSSNTFRKLVALPRVCGLHRLCSTSRCFQCCFLFIRRGKHASVAS